MIKFNLPELPASDADILERTFAANTKRLPVALARQILRTSFTAGDTERINQLSAKARAGSLTPHEDAELDSYLRVGHFLSMMKSKARIALKRSNRST